MFPLAMMRTAQQAGEEQAREGTQGRNFPSMSMAELLDPRPLANFLWQHRGLVDPMPLLSSLGQFGMDVHRNIQDMVNPPQLSSIQNQKDRLAQIGREGGLHTRELTKEMQQDREGQKDQTQKAPLPKLRPGSEVPLPMLKPASTVPPGIAANPYTDLNPLQAWMRMFQGGS